MPNDICKVYGTMLQGTTSSAVTAGQVVSIDATGGTTAGLITVRPGLGEAGELPIGVAIYSAASGAEVAIASIGSVAYVANADDTLLLSPGGWVTTNDNAGGGMCNEVITTVGTTTPIVGCMLTYAAGSSYGYCLITPQIG